MQRFFTFLSCLAFSCSPVEEEIAEAGEEIPPVCEELVYLFYDPDEIFKPVEAPSLPEPQTQALCEPVDLKFCESDSECGEDLNCRRSIALGEDVKVCIKPMPSRREKLEVKKKVLDVAKSLGASMNAQRLLGLVALRESSWRPYKAHNLSPDIVSTRTAWDRLRTVYTDNEFYGDRSRWRTLGLYGMNSPLWVKTWDAASPPEVLCDYRVATWLYLNKISKSEATFRSGVNCDDNPDREFHGLRPEGPTWEDIHRASSSGKYCPSFTEHGKKRSEGFRRRAKKVGLNPLGIVQENRLREGLKIPKSEWLSSIELTDL